VRQRDFHKRNKFDPKERNQMLYYQPKKLDCHLNKALYKLALDSVSKIFHGLKNALEKSEELPNEFSKTFLINCFLKGKSKGGFFDKIRNKLPKVLLGKSLGGKLKCSESKNNISTQDLFEFPSGTINKRS
jgi:hypothetical protein